ncbi:hypothetical protein XBKB1_2400003 [Xenorhabdus bovienii str. kraussei Becker Underwood]|uniref:Uncharacterized protein n=1 Tax=Xenorhabdus bovienii str. kraussei Becker Underwood TaxID=1398204 RepID=A0A077PIH9_XENBV|nr:hypothetical protein XBKB1_2400003 [Xenorhabdus bovienii str. kraussei Becker Underwood]
MAINQIAKIGLSSLQVIYYFEILFRSIRREFAVYEQSLTHIS